ncbi:MAG TPA: SDR family oxidoreductase [Acidimicrobiia bacterium]|nr:SDR family oxidoreductase [Acidimicrobiia bacterium]
MTRVLLTGHLGYIGSVMSGRLVEAGHDVIGLDSGLFEECVLGEPPAPIETIRKDLRDVEPSDLAGFDAVVHLAALSNDPIGNLDETWTKEINDQGSVRLAEMAREAGVARFLFSSSCIMYGMSSTADVDETSPLDPQTEYARSKVTAEEGIRRLASDTFSPVFLRNGTIYGVSPRMRFDTVLNSLVGAAVTTGKVVVRGDGSPWRPVVHVDDVARAFVHVLDAPTSVIHAEAFNVGANSLNHTVRELAEFAMEAVPGSELEVLAEASADRRTYKADFSKFARCFPNFEWRWDARAGAQELAAVLRGLDLTPEQFDGPRYVRLRWLNSLLAAGRLDPSLRWTDEGAPK